MPDVDALPPGAFVVALGSNLGDRHGHLAAAAKAIALLPGTRVLAVSQLRDTAPVGGGTARFHCPRCTSSTRRSPLQYPAGGVLMPRT